MKLYSFLVILLFLCGCNESLKQGLSSHVKENEKNAFPEFEITEEIHNFGKLQAGESVVYIFEYKNAGKGTLEIESVESGCGCLTVEPQEKVVKSGRTGNIKVIFDSSGLFGSQFQAFRVNSTRKGIGMNLAITAEVINENIDLKNN